MSSNREMMLQMLEVVTAFQDVIQSTAQDPDRETLIHDRLNTMVAFGVHA